METVFGAVFCVALFAVVFITSRMRKKAMQKLYEQFQEKDFAYTLVFGSYDWGPGTEKIILNVGKTAEKFSEADFAPEKFTVTVKSETPDSTAVEAKIPVKRAFFCDIDGNEILRSDDSDDDGNSVGYDEISSATHIALELEPHPDDGFTSPFVCEPEREMNRWKKVYDFKISHPNFESEMTECSDWFSPAAQKFKPFKTNGKLGAASFVPENAKDKKKHPLIVWFHGLGEGGTDVNVVTLGNKVTSLAGKDIQSHFDGAFVLCPQTKTLWMQKGENPSDLVDGAESGDEISSVSLVKEKSSIYTAECKAVIDRFIRKNPSIDRNRIYVGGCSNGGYMTLNMLLNYPGFFAGAFPVCEAYRDSWICDEDLRKLSSVPIWFVASKNDGTVASEKCTQATFKRLSAISKKNVRISLFDSVKDTSGKYSDGNGNPYEYNGHWSWIPLFNDECRDADGKSLWEWLSEQKKI